jgi:hypothetical protein
MNILVLLLHGPNDNTDPFLLSLKSFFAFDGLLMTARSIDSLNALVDG